MKKIKNLLFVLVVAFVMAMPFIVEAKVEAQFVASGTEVCATPDADGYCTATVVLKLKYGSTSDAFDTLDATISLKDPDSAPGIKDFKIESVLEGISRTYDGDPETGYILVLQNNNAKITTTEFTDVIKVTYKHLATMTTDCGLKLTTGTTTVDTEPENPSTGNSLPYAILAVVTVGAFGVYLVSTKKSKLHNM